MEADWALQGELGVFQEGPQLQIERGQKVSWDHRRERGPRYVLRRLEMRRL